MTPFDADFNDIDEDFDFDPEYNFEGEWTCTCGNENVGVIWCENCGREFVDVEEEYA